MNEIYRIENITQLNQMMNQTATKHPLVAVVDFSKVKDFDKSNAKITSSFYSVMLKEKCEGSIKYGRQYYDFQDGTLIFIGPEQVITMDIENKEEAEGWGLFFHPDLIRGTSLGLKIREYSFFSYDTNEALHISESEKQTFVECLKKIEEELSLNMDKHSQTLIVSNIELLLNYCNRYYDRQFITRHTNNKGTLAVFETVITSYLDSDSIKTEGLPTVKYCADKLNLSPNYLSDLMKKETGKNAQEHIHFHLIERAKNQLLSSSGSISEIAYNLGFEYPQYFSKMFKKKTGMTPAEYRNSN